MKTKPAVKKTALSVNEQEQAMRKDAAIAAYGMAVLFGAETALNEWEQYVLAIAYGATSDAITKGAERTIRHEFIGRCSRSATKGKGEEIARYVASAAENPHVQGLDIEGAKDVISAMLNRSRQYKARTTALQGAGVVLLSAEGKVRDSVTLKVNGASVTGSLQTIARKLQESTAKKRGPTKRKGAETPESDKADKPESGEDDTSVDANAVPLSDALIGRVLSWANSDTPEGANVRLMFGDQFASIAGKVAFVRLNAAIAVSAQAGKRATAKVQAQADAKANAKALKIEAHKAAEASAKVLRGVMKRKGVAPAGSKARAATKQSERIGRAASKARAVGLSA